MYNLRFPPSQGAVLVSRVSFEVVYDGPALAGHQMDVRELAPALLGVGNLLRVGFESHEARAMRRTRSMTEAA